MTVGRCASGIKANAFGTTSFKACAPKLPPTINQRIAPVRPLNLASGLSKTVISDRTGLPTKEAFPLNAAGKATNTFLASLASTLLVKPATEFCSCITNGFCISHAIKPPGKAAKPPMPNTTLG